MSLFKFVKYSSVLFFLGKYKDKVFRVIAVLLFALVTSLLYQDVVDYLHLQHPGTVVYALIMKIMIVYGALGFVLWQFRPGSGTKPDASLPRPIGGPKGATAKSETTAADPLSALEDVTNKETLRSRYDGVLKGDSKQPP